ncbi:MAG TPA: DUF1707 domain-containing protein [Marmoricola sp.]|jgi:hypothetical protein|nr:DUF1707 domain-containing protein [Marmoricola sp.]
MTTRFDAEHLRITDAEREAAVTALGEHFAVGRLTREEYDERCEAAWAARTRAELRPLFSDLPGPHQPPAAPSSPARQGRPRVARWWPVPLLPVVAILLGITVLTHLPVILFGLLAWFVLARLVGRRSCRRW